MGYGINMRKYLVIFEKTADGFNAYVPDLPGCVAIGDTKEETEGLIYEAIEAHLDIMEESGELIPEPKTDGEILAFHKDNDLVKA